jgi:hypothetical protein
MYLARITNAAKSRFAALVFGYCESLLSSVKPYSHTMPGCLTFHRIYQIRYQFLCRRKEFGIFGSTPETLVQGKVNHDSAKAQTQSLSLEGCTQQMLHADLAHS